jgi:aspartate/methionine/tyrosine aminotransferase
MEGFGGSEKAKSFTESVIREMTRICIAHQGINLAQGFPDFPAPVEIKEEAVRAIREDFNQYSITWGTPPLRRAIAEKFAQYNGLQVDPEREITVCCGSTEGMISSLMAIVNPGEEVIVFEPFYENYGPDAILCGAAPPFHYPP